MKRYHLLIIFFLFLCSFAAKDIITTYFADIRRPGKEPEVVSSYISPKSIITETVQVAASKNAIAETPEAPEEQAAAVYTPNSIQDLKIANPAQEISVIEAPTANGMGSAVLRYPIKLPAGRQGMEPELSIGYNSDGANGWLGMGWTLQNDAIMIETKWGVPRYDQAKETETYIINGEQLSPVAHRTDTITRTADKEFYPRVESRFDKIIRHGDNPKNYWWEVISKNGTKQFFGGTPGSPGDHVIQNAVLTDKNNAIGNIAYWAITETRDTRGNFIKYSYNKVQDSGVAESPNPGYDLYPASISYTGHGNTEGKYRVEFIRDSAGQEKRKDVSINARWGFKQVTADLLRKIRVKYNENNIRTYELVYSTGAFYKTLLQSIKEFDAAGNLFNTHGFEYYNDVQGNSGVYQPLSAPKEWDAQNDNIKGNFLNPINFFNDNASALSGNKSIGGGFGIAITVGPNDFVLALKSITAGVNFGFNYTQNEGMLALVDINGDGLPDKVYKDKETGNLFYRANESGTDTATSFGEKKIITGIGDFSKGESFSGDIGLEANVGPISAGFQYTGTEDITSTYFTDVNGDQLPDIVHNGKVYFNHLDSAKNPHFTLSSGDTPSPIRSSSAINQGLVTVDTAGQEKAIDDNPLHDVVKLWRAPYNGTVSITNSVALIHDPRPVAEADSARDGVRVAIQHKGNELWFTDISANDFTAKTPTNVSAIQVQKGDRIYFRVQSKFNGSYDQVSWSPEITYTNHTAALTDANNLPVYKFRSNDDFLISDPVSTGVVINGAVHMEGNIIKPATTDDITVKILRKKPNAPDSTILLQTYAWNQAVNQPVSIDLNVSKGDAFFFSIASKTNIDWTALQWNPYIYYTASHDTAVNEVFDDSSRPMLNFYPTVDFQAYNRSVQPSLFWEAPFSDTFTIKPQPLFSLPNLESGQLVFSIKKQHQLISKKIIPVTLGTVGSISADTLILTAGEKLYFEYFTDSTKLADKIINPGVRIDTNAVNLVNRVGGLHTQDTTFIFGPMYRNWGQFAYNGNREARANFPINESELVLDQSLTDTTTIDLRGAPDTATMQQIYRDKGGNVPKDDKFIFLLPDSKQKAWIGYDNLTYVKKDTVSSSRMGRDNLLPVNPISVSSASGAGAVGIKKITKSNNLSFSAGVGFPPLSGGLNTCTGDTRFLYDFMDMNGDSYPDILSESKIQYTRSFGGLDSVARNVFAGAVSTTSNSSKGVTLGGSYNKSGSPNAKSTSKGSKAAKSSKQSKASAGLGGNISFNAAEDKTEVAMMDVNGDGLPDRVHRGGMVELNIGYSFLPREQWSFNGISDGVDTTYAGGISINIGFYSISAGVGLSRDENKTTQTLQDMNGDGLLDYVASINPLIVHINTGNGFANPGINWGANTVAEGISTGESANAAFTIGFPIIPIVPVVKLCINPSINIGQGANRTTVQFDDVDGDGFPDFLRSNKDSQLTVSRSTIQRTNLLKKVNRPLGAHFTLDYKRVGNTYEMPNSVWTLASVDMYDGVPGDGADHMRNSFKYQDGRYNRNEREFYGFGKVITKHLDTQNGDMVYRKIEEEYINDNYYEKGLPKSVVLKDAAGNKFTETLYSYSLKDIHTGDTLPNSFKQRDDGAAFPALLSTEQLFYGGQATAAKTTSLTYTYDVLGNITSITDMGDTDPGDDIITTIGYHAVSAKYIMDVSSSVIITGNGQTYRQQATTIDNNTGDVTETRQYLQSGEQAKTSMEYDAYGNITMITRPQNATNQRLSYSFEYDGEVQTYRTKTTDSYDYSSSSTYDVRFGQILSNTDINGQKTLINIDNTGRITTITSPLEIAAGQPFTFSFEYHPEAAVPWVSTKHFDPAHPTNFIETAAFCDGLGRIIQTKKDGALYTGAQTADQEVMIVAGESKYDAFGRTVEEFYPVTEPKGTTGIINNNEDGIEPTRMTYDVLDRMLTTSLPDLSVTTMQYGFGADRNGVTQFRTKATDANGISTEAFTNVRDLVKSTKQQYRQGTDIWTSYDYNAIDELIKVTDDRGNQIISTYDRMGRRTSVNHPDAGLTTYQYDLNNNLTQTTTANLQSSTGIKYSYDQERLLKVTYPQNPQNNVSLTYGAPGSGFFRAGRIIKQQDATGTQEFFYNPLGALVKNTRIINVPDTLPLTYTTQWTFDTWNRLTNMVYPDGEQLSYNYNIGGLLQSMSGVKAGTTYNYLAKMGYDKFESPVYKRYGNGAEMTYAYEAERRRLQKLSTKTAASRLVMDNTYTYDREDNILNIVNNAPLPTANQMGGKSSYQYIYDDLYRLTNANGTFSGASQQQRFSLSMGYDNLSSIISKNQVHEKKANNSANWVRQNQTSYSYSYQYNPNGKPHAAVHIGDKAYSYDANGNQTGWNHDVNAQNRQIEWDEENRVKSLTDNGQLFRYTYDGADQRVLKSTGNGQTVSVNGKPAGQTGGLGNYTIYVNQYMDVRSGGFTKHFYTEEGKIVSKLGETGSGAGNGNNQEAFQFYYHSDHLGNTAFITDRLGEVYQHLEYFPFGETFVEEKSNTWRTPYLYNGKELDAETGLYYYGARYYDSRTSTWPSVDELWEQPYEVDKSPYAYVRVNPVNYQDPDGRGAVKSGGKKKKSGYAKKKSFGPSAATLITLKGTRAAARASANSVSSIAVHKPAAPRLNVSYDVSFKEIGTGTETSEKTRKYANFGTARSYSSYGETFTYKSNNGAWKTVTFSSQNPHSPGEILDAGHIKGSQLGGSGKDEGNIFGQNIAINRWANDLTRKPVGTNSHKGKKIGRQVMTWREWEDKKRRVVVKYNTKLHVEFWAD